jgi:hypothetical protein
MYKEGKTMFHTKVLQFVLREHNPKAWLLQICSTRKQKEIQKGSQNSPQLDLKNQTFSSMWLHKVFNDSTEAKNSKGHSLAPDKQKAANHSTS